MKKILLILSFLPLILKSQPTLNAGNLPKISDRLVFNYCEMNGSFSNIDSGTNITWDISGFVPYINDSFLSEFQTVPSGYLSTFPNATHTEKLSRFSSQYLNMYSSSKSTYEYWGKISGFPTLSDIFSDGKILLKYPFTFNSNFKDDYKFKYSSMGDTGTTSGNQYVRAAGYGTLKLPKSATYKNTLLVISDDKWQNNKGEKFKAVRYEWFSSEYIGNLATITLSYRYFNGKWVQELPTMFYQKYPAKNPLAMIEVVSELNKVDIFPNPGMDFLNIKYDGMSLVRVEILNDLGQIIHSEKNIQKGILHINISSFNPGNYFINLEDNQGNITQKKFLK